MIMCIRSLKLGFTKSEKRKFCLRFKTFLLCNMSGYDFGPALVVFVLGFANLLQNSTTSRDKGDQVGIFLKNKNVMYILLLL